MEGMSPMMQAYSSYEHWIKGTYLISSVKQCEANNITIPLLTRESVTAIRSKLNDKMELFLEGKTYRLVAEKSLGYVNNIAEEGDRAEALHQALKHLPVPAEVVLASTTTLTSADDSISAVNISRRVAAPVRRSLFDNAVEKVALKYPQVRDVQVQHFIGGPVQPEEVATCIVTGEKPRLR